MKIILKTFILSLILTLYPCFTARAANEGIALVITADAQSVQYGYKGKTFNLEELLNTFHEDFTAAGIRPTEYGVYILANEGTTLNQLTNIKAALQKFGFSTIFFFNVWPNKRQMQEIKFEKPVPFSTDPVKLQEIETRPKGVE